MGLKEDKWIEKMCKEHDMINPFSQSNTKNVISYGLSSYGYDVRISNEFIEFKDGIIDPKNMDAISTQTITNDFYIMEPNSFILARTQEYFKIPRDVLAICLGKSTYARCGIIVNVTPFEPEFEGHITIEISNTTSHKAKIYANEGIAQVLFFQADAECKTSYKDKNGKYQGQVGVTLPRMQL